MTFPTLPTVRVPPGPLNYNTLATVLVNMSTRGVHVKGGPEPLEKEIHDILGSKREDRFSNPFFELVQKTCQVIFRTCFGLIMISVSAHGHCENSRRSARR